MKTTTTILPLNEYLDGEKMKERRKQLNKGKFT